MTESEIVSLAMTCGAEATTSTSGNDHQRISVQFTFTADELQAFAAALTGQPAALPDPDIDFRAELLASMRQAFKLDSDDLVAAARLDALAPLTDEQIDLAWRSVSYNLPYAAFRLAVGRAIEAALGIPGDRI